LGLFKYILEYTKDLLNDQCKRQVMQNFEQRLMLIPRHQGLKILKNISEITRMTADEFRNLIKVIIFALDNLYKDYRKPGISNKWLCSVYHQFLLMYIASRKESFTDNSLTKLQ
ncbi:12482_t:CDS:1, partial [Dentiscutata erythropus]